MLPLSTCPEGEYVQPPPDVCATAPCCLPRGVPACFGMSLRAGTYVGMCGRLRCVAARTRTLQCSRHGILLPATRCRGRLQPFAPGRDICRHMRRVAMCRGAATPVWCLLSRPPGRNDPARLIGLPWVGAVRTCPSRAGVAAAVTSVRPAAHGHYGRTREAEPRRVS